MRYFALVEDWPGGSMVYFRELPGCFSSEPTYEEALKAAPAAIASYLNWLKKNDLDIVEENDGKIEVVVKERLAALDQIGPRFETDLAPPGDVEIDNALNVAAVARAELLELYDSAPQQYRDLSKSPGAWSLTQHLQHIVESEAWYISRLTEQPAATSDSALPSDLSMALFDDAMDHELLLRGLSLAERERIFLHEGAEWTAAKVLRRMTKHLREHYPWMVTIADQLSTK
jgi:predicted RNase H-like HicB family nuclease